MGCCNVYGSVTTLTVLFPVVPLEWGPIITLQYFIHHTILCNGMSAMMVYNVPSTDDELVLELPSGFHNGTSRSIAGCGCRAEAIIVCVYSK